MLPGQELGHLPPTPGGGSKRFRLPTGIVTGSRVVVLVPEDGVVARARRRDARDEDADRPIDRLRPGIRWIRRIGRVRRIGRFRWRRPGALVGEARARGRGADHTGVRDEPHEIRAVRDACHGERGRHRTRREQRRLTAVSPEPARTGSRRRRGSRRCCRSRCDSRTAPRTCVGPLTTHVTSIRTASGCGSGGGGSLQAVSNDELAVAVRPLSTQTRSVLFGMSVTVTRDPSRPGANTVPWFRSSGSGREPVVCPDRDRHGARIRVLVPEPRACTCSGRHRRR